MDRLVIAAFSARTITPHDRRLRRLWFDTTERCCCWTASDIPKIGEGTE